MTFRTGTGNLLTQDVDALVNTVNTYGVMGKGIALQFKKAWPEMFRAYAAACRHGQVRIGSMHVWPTGLMTGPRFIINFPTKEHWRSRSRLPDIKAGLADLARVIQQEQITSIAVPPLGCGNGGLDWQEVEPLIRDALHDVARTAEVILYPPAGAPTPSQQPVHEKMPRLTAARAALLSLMRLYEDVTLEPPRLIEIQKLAYFLQNSGEPLNLRFEADRYGPYADNLRKALRAMEGHYILGFGDGTAPVTSAEPIELRPGIDQVLNREIAAAPSTSQHLQETMRAIEGFESQYSLELLATVHWVMQHDVEARYSPKVTHEQVRGWNRRKAGLFTEDHVDTAWQAVNDRELLRT